MSPLLNPPTVPLLPLSSAKPHRKKNRRRFNIPRINSSTALLTSAADALSSSGQSSPITKIQTKHGERIFTYEDSLIRFRPKLSSLISTRPSLHCLMAAVIMSISPLIASYNIAIINTAGNTFRQCTSQDAHTARYKWFSECIQFESTLLWGIAVALFNAGALLSAPLSPMLSDLIGRYHVVYFSNFFNILGICLQVLFNNWISFSVGRFITGLHSGITTIIVNMYLDEISPPNLATFLGGAQAVGFGLGLVLGSTMGIYFSGNFDWRLLFGASAVLSMIHLYCLPFCPQSPRFLLKTNGTIKAHQALLDLRADVNQHASTTRANRDQEAFLEEIIHGNVQEQMEANRPIDNEIRILEQELLEEIRSSGFRELFMWENVKNLMVCVFLNIMAPASGVVAVFYYSTSIFHPLSGVLSPSLVTLVLFATYFTGGLVSVLMMWRFKRRSHLLLWDIVECVAMCALAFSFIWAQRYTAAAVVAAVSTVIFLLAHSTGLGPLVGVLSVEYFNHRVRGKALGALMISQFLSTITISLIFPLMAEKLGGYVFLPFLGVNLIMLTFLLVFVHPKTIHTIEKEAQDAAGRLAEEDVLRPLADHDEDVAVVKVKNEDTGAWEGKEMAIGEAIEALQHPDVLMRSLSGVDGSAEGRQKVTKSQVESDIALAEDAGEKPDNASMGIAGEADADQVDDQRHVDLVEV